MYKSKWTLIFSVTLLLGLVLIPGPVGNPVMAQPQDPEPRIYLPLISMPPMAPGFDTDTSAGFIPLTVNFTNTSSGPYTSLWWSFGDGVTSTLGSPSHTYTLGGVYTVTLTLGRLDHTVAITDHITATSPLQNGGFENGWQDLTGSSAQEPNAWTRDWLETGEPLYDDTNNPPAVAAFPPECVHKLNYQLPPHEQLGGPNALVLDGEHTYKVFNGFAAFGAQLTQTVTNLQPGVTGVLTVPILLVTNGDTAPWGGESGAWVNGIGNWATLLDMGNRNWYYHRIEFTVPANGQINVLIRFKNKQAGKDFFIDAIQLELAPAGD